LAEYTRQLVLQQMLPRHTSPLIQILASIPKYHAEQLNVVEEL